MMVTGVWEDNDPSLSVRCKAEGRPRALPRVEVAQVGNIMMMILMMMILVMLMMMTSVVKADFLKAVRKAVSKRLIRLLYVVNRMNDCFKMRKTSVRLRTLNFF